MHCTCPSVRNVSTIYSNSESRRNFTFCGHMTLDTSNWESNLDVKRPVWMQIKKSFFEHLRDKCIDLGQIKTTMILNSFYTSTHIAKNISPSKMRKVRYLSVCLSLTYMYLLFTLFTQKFNARHLFYGRLFFTWVNTIVRWVGTTLARRTNNRKVVGSRPTKVVCITVLTDNRLGWTVRCGRPPLLLPSCRKLEFRLSALMDSDLAWVNVKSARQSWWYADAFQRSIISGAIFHFSEVILRPKWQRNQLSGGTHVAAASACLIRLLSWQPLSDLLHRPDTSVFSYKEKRKHTWK